MKIIANYTDTEIFNSSKIVKLMMVNRFVLHATLRSSKSHYLSVESNPCYHRTDNTNDIHEIDNQIMLMSATQIPKYQ